MASYASARKLNPFTGSSSAPGTSRKAQPRLSRIGSTTDMLTTSSRPLSIRTITVRCAQGHASDTYRW